jgi:hypothetical protein
MSKSATPILTAITRAVALTAIAVALLTSAAASGAASDPAPVASAVPQAGSSPSDQQVAIDEVQQSRAVLQSHFDK